MAKNQEFFYTHLYFTPLFGDPLEISYGG